MTIERVNLIGDTGNSVSLASLLQRNDLALAFRSHTAAMWENRSVLPRAFIVHRAEIVADDAMLPRLREPDFRPDQVALLSDGLPLVGEDEGIKDEVVIAEYKPERVVIRVVTNQTGYLILTDTWYPGWEASLDGAGVPIHRADYIFRAVLLQPGTHTVVFEYHPQSFILGAWVSIASVVATIVLGIAGRKFA